MYTRPRQVAKTREREKKKNSKDTEHDGRLSKRGVKTEATLTKRVSDKGLCVECIENSDNSIMKEKPFFNGENTWIENSHSNISKCTNKHMKKFLTLFNIIWYQQNCNLKPQWGDFSGDPVTS